ncbi:unnamed protein product, partial [Mesorhabditis spiculigera]
MFIDFSVKKGRNETLDYDVELTYPISRLITFDIPIHLERSFFGVETSGATVPKGEVSNVRHIKLVLATFLGELRDEGDDERMAAWEMAVYRWAAQNPYPLVEVLVIGSEIVDVEINREAQRMSPYFAYGFGAMFLFVCSTVYFSALYFDRLNWWTVIVGLCSTLVPVVAITSTLGTLSLFGCPINQLLLIMPFLIMGIGVNDSFLTVHAWLRQSNNENMQTRMGRVFEEVGPSITTTTLTNVITFLIGAFTPTSEISIFCFGTALALGMAYIYTLILFGPILYYSSPTTVDKEGPRTVDGWRLTLRNFLKCLVRGYAKVISHPAVAIVLLLGSLVYWFFAVKGTVGLESKLDTGKILPIHTPIRRPNRLMEEIIWPEYYPLTVIVNNPPDIRKSSQLARLIKMHEDFERMEHNRGKIYTLSWIRAYQSYYEQASIFDFDEDLEARDSGLSYGKLEPFLNDTLRRQYQSFVKLTNSSSNPIQRFSLVFVFEKLSSWEERIRLVEEWRGIVNSYSEMNATIYDVNAMFVDQIISLKPLAMQSAMWTLI